MANSIMNLTIWTIAGRKEWIYPTFNPLNLTIFVFSKKTNFSNNVIKRIKRHLANRR